jgi:rRNA maturation protein Nop10
MKVIKPGKIENILWTKEEKCTGKGNTGKGCGAVLLLEEGDLYHTYSHCRDETDTYTTFTCPQCGTKTDIKYPGVKVHLDEKTWKAWQEKKKEEEFQEASFNKLMVRSGGK